MSDRSADSIHHTDDDAALGNSIHDAAEPDTGASQAQDEEEQEMPLLVSDRLDDDSKPAKLHFRKFIHNKIPPGVNPAYFSRCYNNSDSTAIKNRNTSARLTARISGMTYQRALRQLASRICLEETAHSKLKEDQKQALIQTRAILGHGFIDFMRKQGGIEITIGQEWTYTETMTAAEAAFPMEDVPVAARSRKSKHAPTSASLNNKKREDKSAAGIAFPVEAAPVAAFPIEGAAVAARSRSRKRKHAPTSASSSNKKRQRAPTPATSDSDSD